MINAFTIDVEDYWQNYSRDWLGYDAPPSQAVVACTEQLLMLLQEHHTHATFFVVGQVAQAYPHLIRTIADSGHEIASHGQHHYQVHKITPELFNQEIRISKITLEDITGRQIQGHRATSFTVMPSTQWALTSLAHAGYTYDSSVFPFPGRRYGWPGFPRDISLLTLPDGHSLIEVPMTVVDFCRKPLPAGGGGYLRHFPYAYTRWAVNKVIPQRPCIVYVHPYDLDTQPPPTSEFLRVTSQAPLRWKTRDYFQRRNRHTVKDKLSRLLKAYRFDTILNVIETRKPLSSFPIDSLPNAHDHR